MPHFARTLTRGMAPTLLAIGCTSPPAVPPEAVPAPVAASVAATVAAVPTHRPRAAAADAECADCHPEFVESFARTGMGRALAAWPPPPPPGNAGPSSHEAARRRALEPSPEIVHAPTGLRYRTEVDATGRAWQIERMPGSDVERRIAAEWVVGSGNHTVSFLGRAGDRLVQLPLTWYTQRGLWDLSPGYERAEQPRFERGVEGPCLFCHNDLTPLRSGSADTYEPPLAAGIGCNRCHGDGAAHVEARQAGRTPGPGTHDPWIFNPRHAPPALQLDVCRACHLQGDAAALRPGRRWDTHDPAVPLSEHHVVFAVAGPADDARFSIASHAERLAESRCATESTTPLVCTTCHDPHRPAAEAERAAGCARCHGPSACAVPAGKRAGADCVPCHMRRGPTSDIPHVRFTDHRIARRPPETPEKAATPVTGTRLVSLTGPLPPDEAARLTGLAHTHLWERLGRTAHRRPAIEALRGAGGAADVLAALGRSLMAAGDAAGAVEAFARAAAAPDAASESGLALDHAAALNALGRRDDAIAVLRAAGPERRPDVADALALALLSAGRAAEAASAASAGVAVAPGDAVLQARLGAARLKAGDAPGAATAFEAALRLDPLQPAAAVGLAALLGEAQPGRAAAALDPLARQPGHVRVNLLLARLHRTAGAAKSALDAVARLEAAGDAGPPVFAEKALAQAAAGQVAAARRTVATARAAYPENAGLEAVARQLGPAPR